MAKGQVANKGIETKAASYPISVPFLTSGAVVGVAIALHFVQGEQSPFSSTLPDDCLVYPPSSDCVNVGLPWMIGGIGFLLVVNVISTITEKPTRDALDNIEKQSERRHEFVKEMVEELEDREDLEDGEIHGIRYSMIFDRMKDLVAIPNPDQAIMDQGFRWAFALYKKELQIAIKKTKEGEDIFYASGKKLGDLLDQAYKLCDKAAEGKAPIQGEKKTQFWCLVREGRKLYLTMGVRTLSKAFQMIFKAKNALPWVALQTVGTMVTAVVDASAWHYRVVVLEAMFQGGDQFWSAAKAMFLIGILRKFLSLLTDMMAIRGAKRASCDTMVIMFDALVKMEISWWAIQAMENAHRDWEDKISMNTVWMVEYATEQFLEIPQDIVDSVASAISHAVIIWRTSSKALWLQLGVNVGLSLIQWLLRLLFKRMETMAKRGLIAPCEDDYTFFNALRPEYISTFQSYVRGEKEVASFKSYIEHEVQESKREALVECLEDPIMKSLSMGGEVAQMSLASDLVSGGQMGVAQANGVMDAAGKISREFQGLWKMATKAVEKAHPLARAYDLCSLPKTIDPDVGLRPAGRCNGHVKFEDVRFAYPRRDVEVLKGVTFEVMPGETLGMTGTAGCGKSTAMRLLERFYDVTGGKITLDGTDIREYNPRWLRSQIATVAQEPMLLPGMTIRENITFGCPYEPSLEQIHDACRAANIYDSLMNKEKFPSGLRTEMGAVQNVSGGEKQRIAIARAIMADPPILLLDEATSALDEENQSKVQEALNTLMEGRTTLVIAHRLSTIKDSDKIVAFKAGKVVECGTHEELVSQEDSVYGSLWKKQCSHPESIDEEITEEIHHQIEEEEDDEEEEVEIGVTPVQRRAARRASLFIAGGSNPPLSTATRLEILEQRVTKLSQAAAESSLAHEIKKLLDDVEKEVALARAEKAESDRAAFTSEDSRAMVLKATGINRWKSHMEKTQRRASTGSDNGRLRSAANKILFLNRHAKIKQQLSDAEESAQAKKDM